MTAATAGVLPDCVVLAGKFQRSHSNWIDNDSRMGALKMVGVAGNSDNEEILRMQAYAGESRIGWFQESGKLKLRISRQCRLHTDNFVPLNAMVITAKDASRFATVVREGQEYHFHVGDLRYDTTYTYTITLIKPLTAALPPSSSALVNYRVNRNSCYTLAQNDVCFLFSHTDQVLFARQDALIAASPYYRDLFHSGFAESSSTLDVPLPEWATTLQTAVHKVLSQQGPTRGKRPRNDDANSDAEDDSNARPVPAINRTLTSTDRLGYVYVQHHNIRTYRAMLHYIETGDVTFSTLQSRREGSTPTSWTFTSPKSMFALAHEADLEHLQQLAVANFKQQLDATNIINEIFSDACITYASLKTAAFDVLRDIWPQLRANGGLDQIDRLLEGGRDPVQIAKMQTEMLRAMSGLDAPQAA